MILLLTTALADCSEDLTDDAVDAIVVDALAAYETLEADRFSTRMTELEASVPCLKSPMPRRLAAAIHRARGLRDFVAGDHDGARASFAAARAIEPAYAFPTSLVPEGNPVLDDYAAIDPASRTRVEPAAPQRGNLRVDGSRDHRLEGLPAILQWLGDDGAVQGTWLIEGDAPDPRYPRVSDRPDTIEAVGRAAHLYATVGGMYLEGRGRETAPGMGTVSALAAIPVGPIDFEVGGLVAFTRDDVAPGEATDERFLVTPALRAGLRLPIDAGSIQPWVGACGLLTFHGHPDAPPVAPGGAGTAGLFVPLGGSLVLAVDALAGYDEGLVAQGGLGLGVGL